MSKCPSSFLCNKISCGRSYSITGKLNVVTLFERGHEKRGGKEFSKKRDRTIAELYNICFRDFLSPFSFISPLEWHHYMSLSCATWRKVKQYVISINVIQFNFHKAFDTIHQFIINREQGGHKILHHNDTQALSR